MLWLHFFLQVIYHALTSCHLLVTHGTTFTANQAAEKQTSFYTWKKNEDWESLFAFLIRAVTFLHRLWAWSVQELL